MENIPYKNHPLNCVDRREVGNLQVSEKWNLAKRALLQGRLQEQRVAAIRGDTKLAKQGGVFKFLSSLASACLSVFVSFF